MTVFTTRHGRNDLFGYIMDKLTARYGSIKTEGNSVTDGWEDFTYTKTENGIRVVRNSDNKLVSILKTADEFDNWMAFVIND